MRKQRSISELAIKRILRDVGGGEGLTIERRTRAEQSGAGLGSGAEGASVTFPDPATGVTRTTFIYGVSTWGGPDWFGP